MTRPIAVGIVCGFCDRLHRPYKDTRSPFLHPDQVAPPVLGPTAAPHLVDLLKSAAAGSAATDMDFEPPAPAFCAPFSSSALAIAPCSNPPLRRCRGLSEDRRVQPTLHEHQRISSTAAHQQAPGPDGEESPRTPEKGNAGQTGADWVRTGQYAPTAVRSFTEA
jgi:hypothetical protein